MEVDLVCNLVIVVSFWLLFSAVIVVVSKYVVCVCVSCCLIVTENVRGPLVDYGHL